MHVTGLKIKLGSIQHQELSPQDVQHQHFQVMSDDSLAQVQEQHTADLLAVVADYIRQTSGTPKPLKCSSEDSLAAVQQHQMVAMIKEVTQYFQQDLMRLQQTCKELAARQG